jgi:hypothetical protein
VTPVAFVLEHAITPSGRYATVITSASYSKRLVDRVDLGLWGLRAASRYLP